MSAGTVKLKLSKPTAECVRPDAPKDIRMMAAEGKLPVEAKELLTALYYLANDKDQDIRTEAQKSLRNFPRQLLDPLLSSPDTHPRVLDYISRLMFGEASVLELIVKNGSVEPKTVERIAEKGDENLLGIIAEDFEGLKENPQIVEAIKKNPSAPKDLIEKIDSLTKEPGSPEAGEEEKELPKELPKELIEESEDAELEEESKSLYKQILDMGVSQKIKLAITGNKEARSLLIKEPNRLICGNVMKNPRITDGEVLLFSASKSVGEEVFRQIESNKDWMKIYQVKLNLASNPRVKLPSAMKLISHLRQKDLEILSKSRNVSRVISNMARRILSERKGKK